MFGTKNTSNYRNAKHFHSFLVEVLDMFKLTFINLFINNKWQREDCAGLYNIGSILHESNNKSDIQKVYLRKWLLIPTYYYIDICTPKVCYNVRYCFVSDRSRGKKSIGQFKMKCFTLLRDTKKAKGQKDSLSILLEHGSLGITYVPQKQNYSKFKLPVALRLLVLVKYVNK